MVLSRINLIFKYLTAAVGPAVKNAPWGSCPGETFAVEESVKDVSPCVNMVWTKANYVPGAHRKWWLLKPPEGTGLLHLCHQPFLTSVEKS